LLVEEISLVDKAATRRKFVLVKRDVQNKPFEVSEEESRRTNFMGFETKDLETGEVMEFERTEELALPPDVIRQIKMIIGSLSKLIGYKYKAKYKYQKPGDEKEKEEEQAKRKKKEEEDKDEEDKKKKEEEKKKNLNRTPKKTEIESTKVSEELEKDLKNLAKLTESEDFDQTEVQKKIDEILERVASDSGGED
ncbi:unnamed protein product, partial [marine sediment metagenome]